MAQVFRLPYPRDVASWFDQIVDQPWAVWLDSGHPGTQAGRFDILAADPYIKVTSRSASSQVEYRDGRSVETDVPPLQLLRELLGDTEESLEGIPFQGGAIGYLSYDLGRRLEGLPDRTAHNALPQMAVGIYDWAVLVDHLTRRAWLVGQGRDTHTASIWEDLQTLFTETSQLLPAVSERIPARPVSHITAAAYERAFDRIQHYIREGDCYQVNYAQRFSAPYRGGSWQLYRALRETNPAPYAAYLNYPFAQVLSSSPECFLSLQQGNVVTRPIKGTRPRGETLEQDQAIRNQLQQSSKDRAENLMIVDLLRNDLGKVCKPGSIHVPELFKVESFATVHHLVSTVGGRLRQDQDALSLLQACFPGGSITGAPKHRAMQIIDELEPEARGIYCGSIGWIGFDGNMDSNIAIRTLLLQDAEASYWAGGGIVADSDVHEEYQECLDKAAAFFQLT